MSTQSHTTEINIGDHVYFHNESNEGMFYSVVDIKDDVLAIQKCEIKDSYVIEAPTLDVVLLTWNKKTDRWEWVDPLTNDIWTLAFI